MSAKDNDVNKIRDYLVKQNRPYSLNDLFLNLHKEIGKTAVQKCLDQLVASGDIKEKVYGKQKVYVTDQSRMPSVNEAELKSLEKEVAALSESVAARLQEAQQAEDRLKSLLATPTTEEALKQAVKLEGSNRVLEERLKLLQESQSLVSPEERKAVQQQRTKAVLEWRKRRRLTREVLDAILEGYPNSKKELYEEIGIETDEDAGVKMPP